MWGAYWTYRHVQRTCSSLPALRISKMLWMHCTGLGSSREIIVLWIMCHGLLILRSQVEIGVFCMQSWKKMPGTARRLISCFWFILFEGCGMWRSSLLHLFQSTLPRLHGARQRRWWWRIPLFLLRSVSVSLMPRLPAQKLLLCTRNTLACPRCVTNNQGRGKKHELFVRRSWWKCEQKRKIIERESFFFFFFEISRFDLSNISKGLQGLFSLFLMFAFSVVC